MTKLLLLLVCLVSPVIAQNVPEGLGQGYDGELTHVTSQLLALAQATPADKFGWRPAAGVRSTSEVYMHIAVANLYYLSVVGKEIMPSEIKPGFEKSVTAKADVISWLKRSLDAARDARAKETPKELERKVEFFQRSTTADAVYLRLIIHCNEHMGQLVAYARMTGVTPPWSK
ncbi:MAG TPA: DinB family protein [Candidatus Sulfotelmatobacter sp.]|nr:DinB family protein [Candidatus Sulfotelmatobacter sp.]